MRIKTNREGALADDVPPDEHGHGSARVKQCRECAYRRARRSR